LRAKLLTIHCCLEEFYVGFCRGRILSQSLRGFTRRQASSAAERASRPIANFVCQVDGIVRRATNAASESVNAKVQRIKRTACGFRSRERFRSAILFKLGGLDLYPAAASATHTTS